MQCRIDELSQASNHLTPETGSDDQLKDVVDRLTIAFMNLPYDNYATQAFKRLG